MIDIHLPWPWFCRRSCSMRVVSSCHAVLCTSGHIAWLTHFWCRQTLEAEWLAGPSYTSLTFPRVQQSSLWSSLWVANEIQVIVPDPMKRDYSRQLGPWHHGYVMTSWIRHGWGLRQLSNYRWSTLISPPPNHKPENFPLTPSRWWSREVLNNWCIYVQLL